MNKAFAAIAALGLFATSAPAVAQEGADVTVTYDDLDLDSAKGQKELDRRIEKAARQVCGLDRQRTRYDTRSPDYRMPRPRAQRHARICRSGSRLRRKGRMTSG